MSLPINLDTAARFIEALTGDPNTPCTWQVFDDRPEKRKGMAAIHNGSLLEVSASLTEANERGCGVFVGVNETDLKGRKTTNVTKVRALFIDKDEGELPPWHLDPSIVVKSARGQHAYWLVGDGSLTMFGAAQKALAAHYGSDMSVSDLPRVMRVPGFVHNKGTPREVALIEGDRSKIYSVDQVLQSLPPPPLRPAPAPSALARPALATPPRAEDFQPGRHGDWRRIDLPGLFRKAGLYRRDMGGGKHAVICPWSHEHTDHDDSPDSHNSSTVIWAAMGGGYPGFDCKHAHCVAAARKLPQVLDALQYDVGASAHKAQVRSLLAERQATQHGDPVIAWPFSRVTKDLEVRPLPKYRENTQALLNAYGFEVRHNLMQHRMEIVVPRLTVAQERQQTVTLDALIDTAVRHGLTERDTLRHLSLLAKEYHPVSEWILSKQWDGVDRVQALLATVKLRENADHALSRKLILRWLIGCVCSAVDDKKHYPHFKPQGVLTFQGQQAQGKTSWLLALAPKGSGWVAEGLDLDPHDRDSVQRLTSYWIAELGEVDATFKKADIAALKAFVIRDTDVYRSAYERRAESVPRRTMLAATVNRPDFLVDPTGNRRFWVVQVESLDFDHKLDMQQLWAQLRVMAVNGERWWLDKDELAALADSNAMHDLPNSLRDEVAAHFDILPSTSPVSSWMSLKEIAKALPLFDERDPTTSDLNALARVLNELGADRGRNRGHTATGNKWPVVRRSAATPAVNPWAIGDGMKPIKK